MRKAIYKIIFSLLLVMQYSCVEEIEFENDIFEDVVVFNAVITNESKQHQVTITRTYPFEDGESIPEINASVKVIGGGQEYNFSEIDEGIYQSDETFAAIPNVDYQFIAIVDGKTYSSQLERLGARTEIDNLYALRETNDDGVNGMSIYVDSYDASGKSEYYRYEYEETYKIIPPLWVNKDLMIRDERYPICSVRFVERLIETKLCYNTDTSNTINLFNTTNLTEDRVTQHLARFVPSDNYILSYRYSILVKQFVQSAGAYEYLETLTRFANEGSLFSQVQAGFLKGNIINEANPDEKVVGYFDVSSVSSKRIFFNYENFYPNEPLPPYTDPCVLMAPARFGLPHTYVCGPLFNQIRSRGLIYFRDNTGETEGGGPYIMVNPPCGDCTTIGEVEVPEFWIE